MALLVVVGVGIVPSTVVADDDWPDSTACSVSDAPVVETTGEYNVQINSPNDIDVIKFRLQKGEYIHFSTIIPDSMDSLVMNFEEDESGGQDDDFSITDLNGVTVSGSNTAVTELTPGVRSSWKFWGEEEGVQIYCIMIRDNGEADVPYEFTLKTRLNDPDPASFESTDSQSELEQKNQRISQLESLLEEKNETIRELRSQSSNGSGSDVAIQVTVTPANGQQFVEGGEAVVQAESENADVSEMAVEYGAGTYQLDSSGQVAIPLAETGTQEMTLIYGDTTKKVSIDVQSQGQNQQNQQNQQDATPSGTSAPGFGIVAALVALLGSTFLLQRYRQS